MSVCVHVYTVPFLLLFAGLVNVGSVEDTVACSSVLFAHEIVTEMVVELICPNGNATYFIKNKHIFAYRF